MNIEVRYGDILEFVGSENEQARTVRAHVLITLYPDDMKAGLDEARLDSAFGQIRQDLRGLFSHKYLKPGEFRQAIPKNKDL